MYSTDKQLLKSQLFFSWYHKNSSVLDLYFHLSIFWHIYLSLPLKYWLIKAFSIKSRDYLSRDEDFAVFVLIKNQEISFI